MCGIIRLQTPELHIHCLLIYKQAFHPVISLYTKYYIRWFETDSPLAIQHTKNIKKPQVKEAGENSLVLLFSSL